MSERPPKASPISTFIGPAALALSVYAGQLKENPLLSGLPFDLTVATVAIVILAAAGSRFSQGPANKLIAFPLIMWSLFIPAIFLSPETQYAQNKVTILFSITLALAIAPFYLLRDVKQRHTFFVTLIIISLFAAVYIFAFGQEAEDIFSTRLILGGTDTIGTGRVAMTGALISAVFALGGRQGITARTLLFSISVSASLLAIFSGSRGPVVAFVIAALTIVLVAPLFKSRRPWAIGGFLAIVAFVLWLARSGPIDGATRALSIFAGETDASTNARLRLWSEALRQIGDQPFGSGWGGFDASSSWHLYPHNIVLEIGVEAGVFVTVTVLALGIFAGLRARRLSFNATHCAMFALFIFSLVNAMVSSDINGVRLLIVTLFAALASNASASTEALPSGRSSHFINHRGFATRRNRKAQTARGRD